MEIINTLKIGGECRVRLLLTEASIRQTASIPPKHFLAATMTDGQANIDCKYWNWLKTNPVPAINEVYDIVGSVSEYQGKMQLTITSITLSADDSKTDFVKNVGISENILCVKIECLISSMKHTMLHKIVSEIYAENMRSILLATSATGVHHVGVGGNALHSIEVAKLGKAMCDALDRKDVSADLVVAGALLHDIGKIETYTSGLSLDYTMNGHLFDHIINGVRILERYRWESELREGERMSEFDDCIDLLEHIIVSHHGVLEFGSPVLPKFIEASIVHKADGISASVNTYASAGLEAPNADITGKVYTVGNKPLITQAYVSKLLANSMTELHQ